jgi:hypothetical protein
MTSLSDTPKKKLGRPVGSKNKPKKIILTSTEVKIANKLGVKTEDFAKQKLILSRKRKPAAAATKSFKRITLDQQRAYDSILNDNIQLMMDNKELVNRINNLEHQAIGYRAVVSYLENQVGLRTSQ